MCGGLLISMMPYASRTPGLRSSCHVPGIPDTTREPRLRGKMNVAARPNEAPPKKEKEDLGSGAGVDAKFVRS